MLRNDPGFAHHGHEGRIAIPAGNEMKMKMIPDPGTGGLAKIEADIDTLWLEKFPQDGGLLPRCQGGSGP